MLINVIMPTLVGILTFMSMINSCSVELSMKKSLITWGLRRALVVYNLIINKQMCIKEYKTILLTGMHY